MQKVGTTILASLRGVLYKARNPIGTITMNCRQGCGACCIAPSIHSAIPGMPKGKPAGVRCIQLSDDNRCLLFGRPERPAFCARLQPTIEMCGERHEHAFLYLNQLEILTLP